MRLLSIPRLVLVSAVLLLAGVLVAMHLLRHRPTDEERIRALFDDAARAAEEKRIGDAVRAVSERFEGEGLDKHGVKQLVAFHVLRGTWVSVRIAGAQIEVRGDVARAVVDAVMSRSGRGTPLTELLPEQVTVHRFTCRLLREKGEWEVTAAAWRPIALEEAVRGPTPSPAP